MLKKKIAKKETVVELNVSPSKAYLATQCLKWQDIKSGQRLLGSAKSMQDGIDKHAEIENDISLVKNWLPANFSEMEVLQEMDLESVVHYKNFKLAIKGKADAVIYDKKTFTLYVYDWKTGGSQVEDLTEEQLVLYAFSAIEHFLKKEVQPVSKVGLIYVNPDLNTSMTKNFNPPEIEKKVYEIIEKIGAKKKEGYNVGEHCLYCPAKSACPELLKNLQNLISPEVNAKPIEKFSEMQLDLIRVGAKVIDELKDRMKTYLTFHSDKTLHGYILADRRGERSFRQDADIKLVAETLGVKVDDLYEKKLLSVKKIEDKGLEITKVKDFIFQPTSKVLKKL